MSKLTGDPKILVNEAMSLESAGTPADEMAKEIVEIIKKVFPGSHADAHFSNNLGASIHVEFALGKDKSEWAHGIKRNDPAFTLFSIWGLEKSGEVEGTTMELERLTGGIKTFPPEGSYLAMGIHKVGFRKVKGDKAKILKGIERHFKKIKDELKKVGDNIYKSSDSQVDYSKKIK